MNEIRKHSRVACIGLAAGALLSAQTPPPSPGDAVETPPQVATYEDIDDALAGTWLLPPGTSWRYFPGHTYPLAEESGTPEEILEAASAEGATATEAALKAMEAVMAWTEEEFDDSAWDEGPSPFYYGVDPALAGGALDGGTRLDEMGDGVTSVYMRATLHVPSAVRYERIVMEIPVDDGFTFHFNGEETKRRGAGDPLVVPGPAFTASTERSVTTRPVPTADLTRTIEDGRNQLAIHAFLHEDDAETFEIHPTVRAEFRRSPEIDRERFDTVAAAIEASGSGPDAERRLTYLRGRHAQRTGDIRQAAEHFARLAELDPASELAWSRRVECHRELGSLAELEAQCRALFTEEPSQAMIEAWTSLCLEDLRHTPAQVAAALPADIDFPEHSLASDTLWLAGALETEGAVRIDAGQARDREVDGLFWSRDRFFAPGSSTRTTASDGTTPRSWGPGRSIRIGERSLDDVAPLYRVPLPDGPYEVLLGFAGNDGDECEPGDAVFDVLLEGAIAMHRYDPVVEAGRRGFDEHAVPVWVEGGFLEVDLRRHGEVLPWLASLEVRPSEPSAYADHARSWVEAMDTPRVFPLVQLGRALAEAGEPGEALGVLERAEALPGFLPEHTALLSSVRLALLPQVHSYASAEGLARDHADLCRARLAEIQGAAGDGDGLVLATYLSGRLLQDAGRYEEALGAFEELIASGTGDPGPYLRMAQCLVAAELPEHAIDILDEGAGAGVVPTDEWFQLWIALNLRTLGREPWSVIEDLERLGAPDELVVTPTSEHVAQTWHVSLAEPPSTSWCRTTFDASPWPLAEGVLGSGRARSASTRSLWNTDSMYAQRRFQLDVPGLLYPHISVCADGAVNTYINGTAVGFVGVSTNGYLSMPARKATWLDGDNVIGMHAFNQVDESAADVGVVQPIADLVWVARQLREHGAIRLNCGGPELTTADGTVWGADRFFGWGPKVEIPEDEDWREIAGTDDDRLYHTVRAFHSDVISTWYQIPVPDGRYKARLHFAEIEDDKAEGERTFKVRIEKKVVIDAYDIVASVGLDTADIQEFETTVSDGWFDLRLSDLDHFSIISALELEPIAE